MFVVRQRPGVREVRANVESVIYPELRGLLLKTVGPKSVLENALRGVPGIERAGIYGSWARRYHGEPGPEPQDIDLLVVGDPDVDAVIAAVERASETLNRDVNPTILTSAEYEGEGSGFVQQVKSAKFIKLELGNDLVLGRAQLEADLRHATNIVAAVRGALG